MWRDPEAVRKELEEHLRLREIELNKKCNFETDIEELISRIRVLKIALSKKATIRIKKIDGNIIAEDVSTEKNSVNYLKERIKMFQELLNKVYSED